MSIQPQQQSKLHMTSFHAMYWPVHNVRRAAEWFQTHFGMEEATNNEDRIHVRLAQGADLVLLESDRLNEYESNPFHIKCNDARKAHALLDKQKVRATDPVTFHHYVDFNVYDPDGNLFGIISDPAWAQHPNNYFRIDGIFLGAAQFESTLAWYQNVLNAEIEYDFTVETPSSPEARMCCFRGVPITIYDSPKSYIQGRFCDFRSSDAGADYNYLLDKGVTVTDLIETPAKISFTFVDPEGREFGIIQLV